jgi:hypothetical protein
LVDRTRLARTLQPPEVIMAAYPPRIVDKRIVERNIRKGLIQRKEFEKFLTDLPDVASQAEIVRVDEGLDDDDDDSPDELG